MFGSDDAEMAQVRAVAGAATGGPVPRLNRNNYEAEAGYPGGAGYGKSPRVLHPLPASVGGKELWKSPRRGRWWMTKAWMET